MSIVKFLKFPPCVDSQPWSDWSRAEDLGQKLGVYEGRPKVAGSDEPWQYTSLALLELLLSSPRYGESLG